MSNKHFLISHNTVQCPMVRSFGISQFEKCSNPIVKDLMKRSPLPWESQTFTITREKGSFTQ